MQSINLILISAFIAITTPLVLIALSAYTLYYANKPASEAHRKHEDILDVVKFGRQDLASRSRSRIGSPRIHKSVRSPLVIGQSKAWSRQMQQEQHQKQVSRVRETSPKSPNNSTSPKASMSHLMAPNLTSRVTIVPTVETSSATTKKYPFARGST